MSIADMPSELLVAVLKLLTASEIARTECTTRRFRHGDPSPVEQALRMKVEKINESGVAESGVQQWSCRVPRALPVHERSWTQLLSWAIRRHEFGRCQAASLGMVQCAFVSEQGHLLMLGTERIEGEDEDGEPFSEPYPGLLGLNGIEYAESRRWHRA